MMKYLQKLGKAIMLPVAVLPVAAIMMGIGYAMCPATMQGGDVTGIVQIIGFALVKIGSAVIDKLPMLFAVGVAIGLSKDQHGAAGLAGLVAFLTVTTVLNSGVVATMMNVEEAPLAFLSVSFPVSQRPFVTTGSAAHSCQPHLLSSQESAVCPSLHLSLWLQSPPSCTLYGRCCSMPLYGLASRSWDWVL